LPSLYFFASGLTCRSSIELFFAINTSTKVIAGDFAANIFMDQEKMRAITAKQEWLRENSSRYGRSESL